MNQSIAKFRYLTRGLMCGLLTLLTLSVLSFCTVPPVAAGPGDLDQSFGTGGKVTTDFDSFEQANALAIQADGKLVAAGNAQDPVTFRSVFFALARYNPNGTLDSSFGKSGKILADFGVPGDARAWALAIQADGKLVVAGGAGGDFALARYNPDGSPDSSFGTSGKVTTDFGVQDTARALTIQADGKLIVFGSTNTAGRVDFALARYNPDGSPDSSFGVEGKVTTDFIGGRDEASALAIQIDGKLVAAGSATDPLTGIPKFALARYNADGSLDSSFGVGGKVTTDFGGISVASSLAIQGDGKLVVAGQAFFLSFALARYNADGSLDSSFGVGGKVTTDFGGSGQALALAIQADGKLVVAGGAGGDFALARYNPDGSLDSSFGVGGKITTDFGGFGQAFALAIQADGKLVLAGGAGNDFALARYIGADLVVVNDLVHLNSLKFSFSDPASDAPPEAKAGSMIIAPALFSNVSGLDICNPFFEIAELSGGNRLLGVFAEDPNPLVGSIQIQGPNGAFLAHAPVVLGVAETMPFEVMIGLQTRQRFNFVVNMRGSLAPQGSCP